MWNQIWGFVTGNAASVVEQVESAVDDYFYTDEERAETASQHRTIAQSLKHKWRRLLHS